jgi:hypothetical protein
MISPEQIKIIVVGVMKVLADVANGSQFWAHLAGIAAEQIARLIAEAQTGKTFTDVDVERRLRAEMPDVAGVRHRLEGEVYAINRHDEGS